ncbi:flavin reductase family protein [Afifella aestuarii]|uniref:flavin reductase family protein n=1 Tax=Afifella aestuarii TaxID=1909496 RepID=UPI000FE2E02E|nr:flavin reductase family protein [Afifella aestuarii]
MRYTPRLRDHGLAHDPFKAIVAPRPIGWISSLDPEGRLNLAPYSFFNAVSNDPHIVMFSSFGEKDSVKNIEATGEFVCNLTTFDLREEMNATSAAYPCGVSEAEEAGLAMAESAVVKPPRVRDAPTALECRLLKADRLAGLDGQWSGNIVVFGEVVSIYVDDRFIRDDRFDMAAARTIARCGYFDYAVVDGVFEIIRPKDPKVRG